MFLKLYIWKHSVIFRSLTIRNQINENTSSFQAKNMFFFHFLEHFRSFWYPSVCGFTAKPSVTEIHSLCNKFFNLTLSDWIEIGKRNSCTNFELDIFFEENVRNYSTDSLSGNDKNRIDRMGIWRVAAVRI